LPAVKEPVIFVAERAETTGDLEPVRRGRTRRAPALSRYIRPNNFHPLFASRKKSAAAARRKLESRRRR
jgi:hypothetical protein